jgi:hypothetical protein
MLRSFRFANHKSFRDEAELLLMPAYDKTRPVVPVAGIFGANASGKSNLLDALRWLQAAVLDSYHAWSPGLGVPRHPFRLEPGAAASPSGFSIGVTIDGVQYAYGLEVDDREIREEWLYSYPRNRRRIIFERSNRDIRLGSTVADYRARGGMLARNTRSNAIFLTVAAHNDLAEVQPVYLWFEDCLVFSDDTTFATDDLARRLSQADGDRVVGLIRAADLGISDITVQQHVGLPAELTERLAEAERTRDSTLARRRLVSDGSVYFSKLEEQPSQHLLFHHGHHRASLSLYDQSVGTRSWLNLVVHALRTLECGGLLVVDEVDASIHPHLTSRLIGLFRDMETNPLHAQLLFTTHDATLLDEEILARDEVWFVEKYPDSGATKLYPLTDFHPRKNENVEGRYLAGGYGAVPVLTHTGFREAIETGRGTRAAA